MYAVDANMVMNGVVIASLITFVMLLLLSVGLAAARRHGRTVASIHMFTTLFGAFALLVAALGFRGRTSENRPWHVFLDMKYQAKYRPQGQSEFFADGRAARLPPSGTVPFDGADFSADAGRHDRPKPDFLKADGRYYRGVANPDARTVDKGDTVAVEPLAWDGGKPKEGYFVARVPDEAVTRAGGFDALLKQGERAYTVHCVACHGASGRGGGGPGDAAREAYGITGAYGMANIASYHQERLREMPDGELFDTISNGRNTMPAYGHQVRVQDRWAIVQYVRALQYAQAGAKR